MNQREGTLLEMLRANKLYSGKALTDLLRRDWAVRVLDAWAELKNQSPPYVVSQTRSHYEVHGHRLGRPSVAQGTTPAAARLACAEYLWPELPESVRAEIGERP